MSLCNLCAFISCFMVCYWVDLYSATPVFENIPQEVEQTKIGENIEIPNLNFMEEAKDRIIRDAAFSTKPPPLDELINSTNCTKDQNKRDRYSSSFFENSTDHESSFDKELNGIFEEREGPRKIQSVHMGEDVTLCWIETTAIHEDGSFEPPKRLVIREYTISFENSVTIPSEYVDCKIYRGEIDANDPDIGETSLFEIIDENTKVSSIVNFTSVSRVGSIVVWKYKQVKCGVGPVATRSIVEWTDPPTNPKKRVEIKVSPKFKSIKAVPKGKKYSQRTASSTERVSTAEPDLNTFSAGMVTHGDAAISRAKSVKDVTPENVTSSATRELPKPTSNNTTASPSDIITESIGEEDSTKNLFTTDAKTRASTGTVNTILTSSLIIPSSPTIKDAESTTDEPVKFAANLELTNTIIPERITLREHSSRTEKLELESTRTVNITIPSSPAIKDAESTSEEPVKFTSNPQLTNTIIPERITSQEYSSKTEELDTHDNTTGDIIPKLINPTTKEHLTSTELVTTEPTVNDVHNGKDEIAAVTNISPTANDTENVSLTSATEEEIEDDESTTVRISTSTKIPILERIDDWKKLINDILTTLKLSNDTSNNTAKDDANGGEIRDTTPKPTGSWKNLLHNILAGITSRPPEVVPPENTDNKIAAPAYIMPINSIQPLKGIVNDILSGMKARPVTIKPIKEIIDNLLSGIKLGLQKKVAGSSVTTRKPMEMFLPTLLPSTHDRENRKDDAVKLSIFSSLISGEERFGQTSESGPTTTSSANVEARSTDQSSTEIYSPTSKISSIKSEISVPMTVPITMSSEIPTSGSEIELQTSDRVSSSTFEKSTSTFESLSPMYSLYVQSWTSETQAPETSPTARVSSYEGPSKLTTNVDNLSTTNQSTAFATLPISPDKFRVTMRIVLEDMNNTGKGNLLEIEKHVFLDNYLIGRDHSNFSEGLKFLNETIFTRVMQVFLNCTSSVGTIKNIGVTKSASKNNGSLSNNSGSEDEMKTRLRRDAESMKDNSPLNIAFDRNASRTDEATEQAIEQSLPGIREDVREGLHHVSSKLANKTENEKEIKRTSDDLEGGATNFSSSNIFDFNGHWRRKRETTEISHWANERIKETTLGRKLRSFTEIDLHRVLS